MPIRELRSLVRWGKPAGGDPALLNGRSYRLFQRSVESLPELLPPASLDLLLTDPPWTSEALPLYRTLGEVATEVVKPGGAVAVLTSVSLLPAALSELARSLSYLWTISVDLVNPAGELGSRPFYRSWRPCIVFVPGEPRDFAAPWYQGTDKVRADPPPRRRYRFEGSANAMAALIELLSRPGEVVGDCFCGAGTVGIAAISCERRFIGSDISSEALALAAEQLSAADNGRKEAGTQQVDLRRSASHRA